ncbi:MAG TPA: dienelactone hydrolase family protein [Anaeromyxobacteraceae bacterium]|nr:dienelactone hydrolase family protein [Anaeromyxobacteraceae bacterium]
MARLAPVLQLAAAAAALAAAAPAAAKVVGAPVEYSAAGVTLKGYYAYDDAASGKRPGVLVVHEWWGLNDYIRKRARMLAELGYAALAVDLYGDGKTADHPQDAGKFAGETTKNFEVAKGRFQAGQDFLARQPQVDGTRVAAIGYCFGGGVVLNMARQGADLRGVASFHGSLAPAKPAQPGSVKAKVVVFNGADDKWVSAEAIEAFKKEMTEAKADFRFENLPGAVHAFTNPAATENGKKFDLPLAYNAAADQKSWTELQGFLKQVFK